jgi:hypothetical protein
MENKKKKIRKMRKTSYTDSSGRKVSHKMAWGDVDVSNKKGKSKKKYVVYPTVAPKKGKENSTKKEDWKKQSFSEARKKKEVVTTNRKKKAVKLAAGSWKKGKDKREAMKSYRKSKRKKNE